METSVKGLANFLNWYMGDTLVKDAANLINGFFAQRGP